MVNNQPSDIGDMGSYPCIREIPWRRKWKTTPVFWPGESHRRRSLAGYRPWVHKESDTTARLSMDVCIENQDH